MTYAEAKSAMEAAERYADSLRATVTPETIDQWREAHAEYLRLYGIAHDLKWREIGEEQWSDIVDRATSENAERERGSICVS